MQPADTRTAILETAARLYADQGYSAVSMRDVATEVGVTPANLYHHFKGKDDLIREALAFVFAQKTAPLADLLEDNREADDRLDSFADLFVRLLAEDRVLFRLLVRELVDGDGERLKDLAGSVLERPFRLISGLADPGRPDDERFLATVSIISIMLGHVLLAGLIPTFRAAAPIIRALPSSPAIFPRSCVAPSTPTTRIGEMRNLARAASLLSLALLFATSAGALADERERALPALPVAQIARTNVPVTYTVPGSVISDGRIEISSRVVGFIERLDVREGQRVSRGDLLVRIDQTDIDEAIRQAEAGRRASEEDVRDAEQDVRKYTALAPSGAVSTETLRKAKVRLDIARANLDKTRSALAAAEAQKGYATVTSPVDGVVVSVAKRSGEMATVGSTILTVESHEVLLLKAFVSESNLSAIDPITPVTVRIDTLKGAAFQGRIRGIVPSGDDVTRRYEINVILPKDPRLVPGRRCQVELA